MRHRNCLCAELIAPIVRHRFSPGASVGRLSRSFVKSIGMQLASLKGSNFGPPLPTVNMYTGISFVSRWIFNLNRSTRMLCSIGPLIIALLGVPSDFALIVYESDLIHEGPPVSGVSRTAPKFVV